MRPYYAMHENKEPACAGSLLGFAFENRQAEPAIFEGQGRARAGFAFARTELHVHTAHAAHTTHAATTHAAATGFFLRCLGNHGIGG